jgi:23S rRNA (uracil1939-C5)-methyltransferase
VTSPLSRGQIVTVTVDKPAAGGRMIARVDGHVVLVAGAIPGERVSARIERIAKGLAYAQTVGIDVPSPDRRAPIADPLCGGLAYAHVTYRRQLDIKADIVCDALARIGRIVWPTPIVVAASPERGYRLRARLHVRDGQIGFFREGSHALCDARATGQLLEATADALDRLSSELRARGGDGVREVEVSETLDASARVVYLETSIDVGGSTLAALGRIDGLSGVVAGGRQVGDAHVTDVLDVAASRVRVRRHVQAFFQGNRYLLGPLASHVVVASTSGASAGDVLDLYAGVGVFALGVATTGARVIAVEGDRVAAADLRFNVRANEGSIEAVHGPVETFLQRRRPLQPPGVVIVDPPRSGMSAGALNAIVRLHARRIVYVSCDVATLARDARRLVGAGYAAARVDAFDLFPNTPHVETVMVFELPQSR